MESRFAGMRRGLVFASLISLIAAACATSTPSPAPSAAESQAAASAAAPSQVAITPAPINNDQPGPNGGKVIRWFIGLGTGGKPDQIAAEVKVADDFNASQKEIYLSVEIYDNRVASNQLQIEIAAGNPPDIIGPVGVEGLNLFRDQLLDLQPLIDKTNYSVEGVPQELVDFFKLGENNATIGVPFAVYPSFLYFNKDLFDEAGLPYPPTKVDEKYDGKDWTVDTLREVAMKLTVDANGNDATSADFDATKVVQWGFDMQYADNSPRAEASLWGGNTFVSDDGKTAVIPDSVRTGEKWFNDGVWKDHFIPSNAQIQSDLLDKGNELVGQPRDERVAHLVHLLRLPGCAGGAQGQELRLRDRPVGRRQDHGQAPRRHVQHPQVDEGPGRSLDSHDRPRRLAGAADPLRRHAG